MAVMASLLMSTSRRWWRINAPQFYIRTFCAGMQQVRRRSGDDGSEILRATATSTSQAPPSTGHDSAHTVANRLRSEEHTSELQSLRHLVCRLLLDKKKPGLIGLYQVYLHLSSSLPTDPKAEVDIAHFFFNDTATTEIYTLSLHDALLI